MLPPKEFVIKSSSRGAAAKTIFLASLIFVVLMKIYHFQDYAKIRAICFSTRKSENNGKDVIGKTEMKKTSETPQSDLWEAQNYVTQRNAIIFSLSS